MQLEEDTCHFLSRWNHSLSWEALRKYLLKLKLSTILLNLLPFLRATWNSLLHNGVQANLRNSTTVFCISVRVTALLLKSHFCLHSSRKRQIDHLTFWMWTLSYLFVKNKNLFWCYLKLSFSGTEKVTYHFIRVYQKEINSWIFFKDLKGVVTTFHSTEHFYTKLT